MMLNAAVAELACRSRGYQILIPACSTAQSYPSSFGMHQFVRVKNRQALNPGCDKLARHQRACSHVSPHQLMRTHRQTHTDTQTDCTHLVAGPGRHDAWAKLVSRHAVGQALHAAACCTSHLTCVHMEGPNLRMACESTWKFQFRVWLVTYSTCTHKHTH